MWASSLVAHTLLKVKIICNYRHHIMKCHCRISGWRRGGPPPSASSPELVEGRCRRVGEQLRQDPQFIFVFTQLLYLFSTTISTAPFLAGITVAQKGVSSTATSPIPGNCLSFSCTSSRVKPAKLSALKIVAPNLAENKPVND